MVSAGKQVAWFGLLAVSIIGTTLLAARAPVSAVLAPIAILLLLVALRRPRLVSAVLFLCALPLMRPFSFGERYALEGSAIALAAAFFAIIDDGELRMPRSSRYGALFVAGAWLWGLVVASMHPHTALSDVLKSILSVALVVACAAIVLASPERRAFIAKGLVWAVVIVCMSAAVTELLWRLRGAGSMQLTVIPAGYKTDSYGNALPGVPVYFPFTVASDLSVYALPGTTPRLLGLGREPGVFAAILGVTFFMLNRVGLTKWRWKALVLVGLFATQSTGGFGAFLMAVAVSAFIFPPRRAATLFGGWFRLMIGLGAVGIALYLAIYSPALGLSAKFANDAISVQTRAQATHAGLAAALTRPFGSDLDPQSSQNAGINVIASMTIVGLIGAILALGGVIAPWMASRVRRAAVGPIVILLVTVLAAQPLISSTGFFVLAMLACLKLPADQAALSPAAITADVADADMPAGADPDHAPELRPVVM